MNIDDIIYVVCLLACIFIGHFLKKMQSEETRKLIGTGIGVLVIIIVSGWQSIHCFFSFALGAYTFLHFPSRTCHIATFITMFGYLAIFRLLPLLNFKEPPGPTNMIEMVLALKVSGIAFEKTASWKIIKKRDMQIKDRDRTADEPLVEVTDYDVDVQNVNILELFQYSFNYIGVLTGPYYRYRTYRDYFETPFKNYAQCYQETLTKFGYAMVYGSLYLLVNYLFPLDYMLDEGFYRRWFVYRLLYVWPTFFIFRMRIYTGLTLSECVCTMAGFGAYPIESDPASGEGPRKRYEQLKRNADQREYSFATINNMRVADVEKCITFREGMKHWNICVQYWLAVNVYKLFPSKKYRTTVTLLVSAFWHGFRPGHYFCIMGAPFYVGLEDMWNKLVRKDVTGTSRTIIDCIFWIAKFFGFSYLGTAFLLVSLDKILKFYASVYYIGYIAWIFMMCLGIILLKLKKSKRSKPEPGETVDGANKNK